MPPSPCPAVALGETGAVRGRLRLVTAGVALCIWCGWVSAYHRSTVPAEVTWVVSVGAVATVTLVLRRGARGRRFGWPIRPADDPWPRPGRGGGRRALRGVAPWIGILAVGLAWDVLGIATGPHQPHLTISALAQAFRPLDAAVLLVWMLVGIGYEVARIRTPLLPGVPPAGPSPGPGPPGPGRAAGAGLVALGGHPLAPGLLLPASRPLGIAFWIAVPVAGLVADRVARRSDGRLADAEEFLRFISTSTVANLAAMAAWAFAGYHLFAR